MYSIYVLIFKTKKKIVLTRNMAKKKVFSVLCSLLSLPSSTPIANQINENFIFGETRTIYSAICQPFQLFFHQ